MSRKVSRHSLIKPKGKFIIINPVPPLDGKSCPRIKVDELVAFCATQLQVSLTCTFFVDYAQRVLLEGFSLESHFKSLLNASSQSNVARHTNIMYIRHHNRSQMQVVKFIFTHPVIRPWGERLPSACSLCKSPRPWSKPVKQGNAIVYVCQRKGCRGVCRFMKPDDVEMLGPRVNSGRWMIVKEFI